MSYCQGQGPSPSFISGDDPILLPLNQNHRVNDVIIQVRCEGDVRYEILSFNPPTPMFLSIRSTSGELSLTMDAIDLSPMNYTVSLRCTDPISERSDITSLIITRFDENEFTPVFSHGRIDLDISETLSPTGRPTVVDVNATDSDVGPLGVITYSIGAGAEPFSINDSTGEIRLLTSLDFESERRYQFIVTAANRGVVSRSSEVFVVINVIDVDDESPRFTEDVYQPSLRETPDGQSSLPTGFQFLVQCTDIDTDSTMITYAIDLEVDPGPFFLEATTGQFFVLSALDYETQTSYSFDVFCYDNSPANNSDRARVIVGILPVNEYTPEIERDILGLIFFDETSPVGQLIATADPSFSGPSTVRRYSYRDMDAGPDGNITYTLGGDPRYITYFEMNLITGDLFISREVDFDTLDGSLSGSVAFIPLTITGCDTYPVPHDSNCPNIDLNIFIRAVNEFAPRLGQDEYNVTVPESFPAGRVILSAAEVNCTDGDLGVGRLRGVAFASPSPEIIDTFRIDSGNGEVSTRVSLDFETRTSYGFELNCSDYGGLEDRAIVRIEIEPENDNVPRFTQASYSFDVSRTTPSNRFQVGTVEAIDDDVGLGGILTYEIEPNGYFEITNNGELLLFNSVQNFTQDRITFEVYVNDGANMDDSFVVIRLTEGNMNRPRFQIGSRVVLVSELSPIGTSITRVFCNDTDSGINGEIRYFIESGSTDRAFTIDTITGEISVNDILILSSNTSSQDYTLLVVCEDRGIPTFSDDAAILVRVFQDDSSPPDIRNDTIIAFVDEDIELNTHILTIEAVDLDTERLNFRLENQSVPGVFIIDPGTGRIITAAALDREFINMYQMTVVVTERRDTPGPERSDTAELIIFVRDANDNPPICNQSMLARTISETFPVGEPIISLDCSDMDVGDNGAMGYSLLNNFGILNISSRGVISLLDMLNFTDRNVLVVEVNVFDFGVPRSLSSTYQVTIFIQSGNENIPGFVNLPAVVEVSEAVPRQEIIFSVIAEDPDRGRFGQITYRIVNSEETMPFGIFSNTGRVFLTQKLNFFEQQVYMLNISAEDSENIVTEVLTVVVRDENEYRPVCESYSIVVTIREDLPPPQILSESLSCSDDDEGQNGNITYSIESGNEDMPFEVASDGSVLALVSLDFETTPHYELLLVVSDDGLPPLSVNVSYTIIVDPVNEFTPQFEEQHYTMSISEDAQVGESIISVMATDDDSATHPHGQISYSLRGSDSTAFSISSAGLLRVASNLDREIQDSYDFTIVASDQGFPSRFSEVSINVNLTDIDDNPPVFTERFYITTLNGTTEINTFVSSVLCIDQDIDENAAVTYSIEDSSLDSRFFRVDSVTGDVFVNEILPVSRPYFFSVNCTSISSISRSDIAVVAVQVILDNNITFVPSSIYDGVIREDAMPVYDILTISAESITGTTLSFELLDQVSVFSVDRTAGALRLLSLLDFETTPAYLLRVEAVDRGIPPNEAQALVQVEVVNINDEQPQIDRNALNISLNEGAFDDTAPPVIIEQLNCSDADSGILGQVAFRIVNGNPDSAFRLSSSGLLQLVGDLDYESRQSYSLQVICEDGGTPPNNDTVIIPINILPVNDNPPDFGSALITISASEALPIGSSVGDPITAVDNDSPPHNSVQYSIISGNTEPPKFAISATSGQLTLLRNLDFESVASFTVVVLADDSGGMLMPDFPILNSTVTVQIDVEDFNDHTPTLSMRSYSGRVDENVGAGGEVILDSVVSCTDMDSGMNGMTTLSLMSDTFAILTSGIVVVSRQLNFEEQRIYSLDIVCRDNGEPSLEAVARLDITVSDVNEFGPRFVSTAGYHFRVSESTPVGARIGQVMAIDEDGGDAGTITYGFNNDSILGDYINFSIDPTTGIISLSLSLDYETRSDFFNLVVIASDRFDNVDVVAVTIETVNEDDNSPDFTQRTYVFSILENSPIGSVVGQTVCDDADDTADGLAVTYALVTANVPFRLNEATGTIVTSNLLDLEQSIFYTFQVSCFDSNANNVSASVTIRLDPFNDFPPVFVGSPYSQTVIENTVIGTSVYQVQATDDDNVQYNTISYRIIDGNMDNGFSIDATSGVVRISNSIDREVMDAYMLTIEAYNRIVPGDTSGSQPLSSSTTLNISIADQNDNNPSILPENPDPVFVFETDGPSTVVHVFTCTDPDFLMNGSTVFSITSLSESARNDFAILENGTLITTAIIERNVVVDVTCSDMGAPPRSSTASVSVNTVSMNDHTPRFDLPQYTLYVDENQEIGVDVMCFTATDDDGRSSPDGIIDYSLDLLDSADDSIGRFVIRQNSGCVFVSIGLDITFRSYVYSITATDRGIPQLNSSAMLVINIRDVVHDPPIFVGGPYTRTIFETAESRTELVTLLCVDQDENDTISYNISSGNEVNLFSINHETGVISIASMLDFEISRSHMLSVQCIDSSGLSASDSVFITVTPINEFTPTLVASTSMVAENSVSLTFVTRLQWIDQDEGPDGRVTFDIISGNINNAFLITETGDVLVRGTLDREARDFYSLNVSISDESQTEIRSSTNFVNITVTDINDNRPLFQEDPYIFGPFEGTESIGHAVGSVTCSDGDIGSNALITYTYDVSDSRPSFFRVDLISGDIILSGDLTQRDSNNITFFVICTDRGLPPLRDRTRVLVVIEEVNRYPPEFTEPSYYVEVPEDTRIIQDTILTVHANDSDTGISGQIQYYLVDDVENRFFIDEDTGDLSLLRSLDFEVETNYTVLVEARDGMTDSFFRFTSTAEITINVTGVNEFTPECIDPVYVSIINETTQGSILNFDCIDRDEGPDGVIVYSFQSGNEMDFFAVTSNGDLLIPGTITANPDNEQFELMITVSDSGLPQRSTSIEVILIFSFANTFAPMFIAPQFNFNASELLEVGTVIGVLSAVDQDPSIQGLIVYTLSGTDIFLVDPGSGELFLSQPLDWETEVSHDFIVFATDSDPFLPLSTSAMVTVTVINENDNRPSCDQQFYSVQVLSAALPGDSVVTLNCTDADGSPLSYTITFESQIGVFSISANTGQVFVSSLLPVSQTVVLTVEVSGMDDDSIDISVSIQVLFSNHDPPAFNQSVYTFSILEDTPLLTSIGTLYASDPDSRSVDLTFTIDDPTLNPEFYINPNTGEVILTVPLDFESQQQYSVGVTVTDGGSYDGSNQLSGTAAILVDVINTNDNAPVFVDGGIYGTTVSETTTVGTTILSISCTDNDDPPFSSPSISSSDFENIPFDLVSRSNGQATVQVAAPLSGSVAYFINITCEDAAGASVDGQIFIFVPEPLAPAFTQPVYEWFVFENEEVGAEFSNVAATSNDGSTISFAITDGNRDGTFYINPGTGVVSLVTSLDYETQRRHGLVVTAVDGANRQSSILLLVQVLDVNDEVPLTPPSALLSVLQNAPIGFPVGMLQCSNADSQVENGSVTYNFTFIPASNLFSVDEYGIVRLEGLLDDTPVYVLPVTCSESTSPELLSTGIVTVEVQFVNQYQPQFEFDTYAFSVREDVDPLHFVGAVVATDRDVGSFGEISYAITGGNPDKFFIDASTGRIGVLTALDRETNASYTLAIAAYDGGVSASESSRMVGVSVATISILDANDNPPSPEQLSYVQPILTNHTVRTPVLQVVCSDPDLDLNGEVMYSLQPADLNTFVIQTDGTILLAQQQSRQAVFNFFAVCTDRGTPPLSSSALVTVTVDFISVRAPVFDQEEYNITISENAPISLTILRVHATPSDPSIGVVYSIQSGNDQNAFHVDPLTGDVQVISPLDASVQQLYSLTIRTSTTGHSILSSLAVLRVTVTDINNNRPIFIPSFYTARINESASLLTPVVQVECTDIDISAEISYSILDDETVPFDITQEGLITVAGDIDYENQTVYSIQVICSDGGEAPMFDTADVRIDIVPLNEFVPEFSMPEYSFMASENSFGTIIGQVFAFDADLGNHGDLVYLLQDPGNFSVVFVDPLSGEVLVANNLDYEQQTFWNLTVIARDGGGFESYALLHIQVLNVNDVDPEITPSAVIRTIPSESPSGFPVQSFSCTDADNSATSLIITSGNDMGYFQLNANLLVWTATASDLSSNAVVSLTLRCQDVDDAGQFVDGYVAVRIQVTDVEAPAFAEDEYTTSVAENSAVDTLVFTVSATGPNPNSISYDLFNLPSNFPFQIDPITGNITLTSMLDREITSLYTFIVRATDSITGGVGLTIVQVIVQDVNDNPPVLTPPFQTVTLQEDFLLSTGFIYFTCADDDSGPNGQLSFSLSAGNTGMTFAIDENGLVSLARSLDFESTSEYNITVQCTDGAGLSDTALLSVAVIGVNEYRPEFENATYMFVVDENLQAGELVGMVRAFDLDSGPDGTISYSVASGIGAAFFTINDMGHIHKNIRQLNATLLTEIRFTIRATDGRGRTSDAQITVMIVDLNEVPRFSDGGGYFVMAANNLTVGTVLLDFLCYDTDSGSNALLMLELLTVAPGLNIRLETLGAEGMVVGSLIINSTLNAGSYEVTLRCGDQGEPSLTTVTTATILVEGVNEPPMFIHDTQVISVPENEVVGTELITVNATDRETGVSYQITAGNGRGTFGIDSVTGVIYLAFSLDYEITPFYVITVTAFDESFTDQRSATTTVNMNVVNVNDEEPVLRPSGVIQTTISESAPLSFLVESYSCSDPDGGSVSLTVTPSYPESPFALSQTSGTAQVLLQGSLDYDLQPNHRLLITCTDSETREGEGVVLHTSASLVVSIRPVNVYPPEFNSSHQLNVSEDASIGEVIGFVEAFDRDGRGVISYVSSSHTDIFVVDSSSGTISLAGTLDRETISMYLITVVASDNDNIQGLVPLTSNTTIAILVTDINDNPPSCPQTTINIELSAGFYDYMPLTMLSCLDVDEGENADLLYTFQENSLPQLPEGAFVVNETTGVVGFTGTVTIPTSYVIVAIVSDQSDAPLTTSVHIVIQIVSTDTTRPRFEPNTFNVSISENTHSPSVIFLGSVLMEALVNPTGESVRFALRPDIKNSDIFIIDSVNGNVTLTNSALLDYDGSVDGREYTLLIDAIIAGNNLTASILVSLLDYNDNSPQFTGDLYNGTVLENQPPGIVVARVEASDADSNENSLFTYSLQNSVGFAINESTGVITTQRMFDREINERYTFVVIATDMGNPPLSDSSLVTITIGDVNDEPPFFSASVYIISIDNLSPPGTQLLQFDVTDEDADGEYIFQIVSSDQGVRDLFTVDSPDGILRQRSLRIPDDHENRYNFTVEVNDGFGTDSTLVIIYVASVTRDTVLFEENVPNQVYNAREFLLLQAFNITEAANYTIEEGGDNDFIISSDGVLTTVDTLDREVMDQYILLLHVVDATTGEDVNLYITVNVRDQNDNAPVFSQNQYTFNISEGSFSTAVSLGYVQATDIDQPGTGASTIEYSIIAASVGLSDKFSVDPNSGEVLVAEGSLDREMNANHIIHVRARDFGEPSARSSHTDVIISINDVNDNNPQFDPLDIIEFFILVSENIQPFSRLTKIVSILPGGIQSEVSEIKFMDRDLIGEVTASLRQVTGKPKYNLTRASPNSVFIYSTDKFSKEDNGTVLEIILRDEPEQDEENPIIKRITVLLDESLVIPPTGGLEPELTDFFRTEIGIAVLVVVSLVIAGLVFFLVCLCVCCIHKIKKEKDPLRNA